MASPKCPVCGATVRTENLSKHLQSVHPREARPEMVLEAEREATKTVRRPPARSLKSNIPRWVPVVAIVLVLGIAGAWVVSTNALAPYTSDTPVNQMCMGHERMVRHDHVNLRITILGSPHEIPANVGISPQCMRPIHTHETDGKLHIESPVPHEFRLRDFFIVWDEPFTSDQILSHRADANYEIVMMVNGSPNFAYQDYLFPHGTNPGTEPFIEIIYRAR
jgi:hypothetical protein